jgi:hypothetical protein
MSRSYTSSPPSACMACSGTALLFFLFYLHFTVLGLTLKSHTSSEGASKRPSSGAYRLAGSAGCETRKPGYIASAAVAGGQYEHGVSGLPQKQVY